MNKKRIVSIIAVMMLVVMTFAGCGNKGPQIESDLSMADEVQAFTDAIDAQYAYDLGYELAYNMEWADNELGWRTAGSDAEHRTADFLMEEMEKIGLQDVQKVGTPTDVFQFNDSSLTIEGTEIDLMPAAYQCSGTDADGITAEIVDVAGGYEYDYMEVGDVKGKIVLAKVDQANEAWIDGYIRCAYEQGAAAIVTWANSGYGEVSEDSINVQDICCEDLIPTVAISANQAKEIKAAIEAGNNMATLKVDVVYADDDSGTTYNVVGKIPGKSGDQQIVLASHYDKYWYGFQDNCTAVSLTFAVAKAMIDSGYVPENDILVVAHGAEEWGAADSQFDWTTGAWGMIEANPDWAKKTICMINTELPSWIPENKTLNIITVPEYRTMTENLITESGLVAPFGDVIMSEEVTNVSNMEDGVSYRWHGVPYMLNGGVGGDFGTQRYHTHFDDADTYYEPAMQTNIQWYGAFAIYMDKMPAMELDITTTCDELEANLNDEIAKAAGVDVAAYKAELAKLKEAAAAHNAKIADVNARYEAAVAEGASDEEIAALRAEGNKLDAVSLKAFQEIQVQYLKADDCDVYMGHPQVNTNIELLQGTLDALDKEVLWGEEGDGALDIAFNMNSYHDWYYYYFGEVVGDGSASQYDAEFVPEENLYWGKDRLAKVTYVGDTTYDLYMADYNGETPDIEGAKAVYQDALDEAYGWVADYCEQEVEGMQKIAKILK